MITEEHVHIAHKLYEMRSTVRRIWPDTWRDDLNPYIEFIRKFCATHGVTEMQVLPSMHRVAKAKGEELPDALVLWMSAATVEILEPTPEGVYQ